ncbi:hypothetical protein [Ureaplasma parvum]|uniref:hypothetical protein n=1 Tax=Ureaplasma parvum TaxID=134821 RepID=UPI0026EBBD4B|nr:hypothetical protein [Ureaplasma parvum]
MTDEQKTKLIKLKQKVNDLEFELDKIKNEFMTKIIISVILIVILLIVGVFYLIINLSRISSLNQKRKSLELKIKELNHEINKIEISLL